MTRPISAVLLCFAFSSSAAAQTPASTASTKTGELKVAQLDAGKPLPEGVKPEGAKVEQVWRWTERDGATAGLALFSSTEKREDDRLVGRRIFVQLFRGEAGRLKQLRLVQDGVADCEFDLTTEFLPGSVSVTDVDADGVPELTFAYDLACRSDVSPATRKLLVLEGAAKHALRGTERLDAGGEVMGGSFKADGFAKEPALKTFAIKRWGELLKTSSLLP